MANMNRCCKEANNYLANVDVTDSKELQKFIDNFNVKIERDSTNGLSSFLLGGIELCLKLSQSIGYTNGEVKTRLLKGNALSFGGCFKNAIKSYNRAISVINRNSESYGDLISGCGINSAYLWDNLSALKMVDELITLDRSDDINRILSMVLKSTGDEAQSLTLLNKIKDISCNDILQRIGLLVDLGDNFSARSGLNSLTNEAAESEFLAGYLKSFELLMNAKEGLEVDSDDIQDVLNRLKIKSNFYHYIDGIINIAEIYLNSDNYAEAERVLANISKKDLSILDLRINRLFETLYKHQGDFKMANYFSSLVKDIISSAPNCTNLYYEESVVS